LREDLLKCLARVGLEIVLFDCVPAVVELFRKRPVRGEHGRVLIKKRIRLGQVERLAVLFGGEREPEAAAFGFPADLQDPDGEAAALKIMLSHGREEPRLFARPVAGVHCFKAVDVGLFHIIEKIKSVSGSP